MKKEICFLLAMFVCGFLYAEDNPFIGVYINNKTEDILTVSSDSMQTETKNFGSRPPVILLFTGKAEVPGYILPDAVVEGESDLSGDKPTVINIWYNAETRKIMVVSMMEYDVKKGILTCYEWNELSQGVYTSTFTRKK